MTCLQAPHGVTGVFESAMIAIISKSFSPAAMAEKNAFRSAQIERPKEIFSTLHPR